MTCLCSSPTTLPLRHLNRLNKTIEQNKLVLRSVNLPANTVRLMPFMWQRYAFVLAASSVLYKCSVIVNALDEIRNYQSNIVRIIASPTQHQEWQCLANLHTKTSTNWANDNPNIRWSATEACLIIAFLSAFFVQIDISRPINYFSGSCHSTGSFWLRYCDTDNWREQNALTKSYAHVDIFKLHAVDFGDKQEIWSNTRQRWQMTTAFLVKNGLHGAFMPK